MKRIVRCVAAVVIGAAGLIGAYQQPAGAVAAAAMTGGGNMANVSGPSTTVSGVTGTLSATAVGLFGICTFSTPIVGAESIIQGFGQGSPFGCWPPGPCDIFYQRAGTQMLMHANCPFGPIELAGFAEPNSVLPTNSFLFQVNGVSPVVGPITISGNITFTPAAGVGLDLGTPLPTSTPITFAGSLTGLLGGVVGSCSLSMTGGGSESYTIGSASLMGTCSGPGVWTNCVMNWAHVGTHTLINGNCSGSIGFQLGGTGEILIGAGGGYSFVGVIGVL